MIHHDYPAARLCAEPVSIPSSMLNRCKTVTSSLPALYEDLFFPLVITASAWAPKSWNISASTAFPLRRLGTSAKNSKSTMKHSIDNERARNRDQFDGNRKYSWQKPDSAGMRQLYMEIQARLGRKLRVSYQEFANEPIPDELVKLLNELEK